jgi:hypothetical protein
MYIVTKTFLDSSMVEHSAVNRVVVGSSPTRGAILRAYSSAVELPAHNRLVPGSIPGGPTTLEVRNQKSDVGSFVPISGF